MARITGDDRYAVGLACMSGHPINGFSDAYPQYNQAFCADCGEPTIRKCPGCQAPLRGGYLGGVSTRNWSPDAFCTNCGEGLPWTTARRQAAQDAIDLVEGLSDQDKVSLTASLADLERDTPRTEVAAARAKILIGKARGEATALLRGTITALATEAAKQMMFPR